jgi:alkanesulfonate monooxygenase SsuD/methylene tetrahydromethanopterin reductase-like flavin-dependent oxidoreductase (luciferase family)
MNDSKLPHLSRRELLAAADVAEQEGMRRRWLEDHLFHDPVTRKMVPYEVWSFADQAPTVMF